MLHNQDNSKTSKTRANPPELGLLDTQRPQTDGIKT